MPFQNLKYPKLHCLIYVSQNISLNGKNISKPKEIYRFHFQNDTRRPKNLIQIFLKVIIEKLKKKKNPIQLSNKIANLKASLHLQRLTQGKNEKKKKKKKKTPQVRLVTG